MIILTGPHIYCRASYPRGCEGKLKVSALLHRYNESVERRQSHALQLDTQIRRLESSTRRSGGRLETRLSLARHRRDNLDREHRAAADWKTTVAVPLFNILSKQLGRYYRGTILAGDTADSLRISFRLAPDTDQMVGPRALTITMQPEGAPLRLSIIRAVCDEHGRWHEEHLSSDTRIADLASCMMEKARQ
ncbi:hypothetical protein AAER06_13060 [Pseudomonas aeruginosa]|uniref:hypothetical protein n=1 Tax=Pseudomonas TaxID=286 RepID=UPI00114CBD84|nr:hypothetical protein [Pseudomonas aeruginosa]MBX6146387.1 hypothetical protein [Pseudomonas aeruginosa]MBX6153437.1 hypothetical protein [Pseudomonas aeruginosa]MBX6176027.1 hypothetical protein [Pseudomonas aeruginosa]MDM1421227.1 hypothetical protein [Pseudomonas aeruginosa]MDM1434769.1 hypothetical protein [Pseudomonas aeruginosa]